MSQTVPSSDKSGKRASSPLAPPDERFWQRYSPHAEFPLSGAGSLVLHVLVLGLLGLMAWLGVALFNHAKRSLPVEAVRLDLSGGGGNPHGQGDAPNTGTPVEATSQSNDAAETIPPEDVSDAKLEVKSNPQLKQPQFDNPTARPIQKIDQASNTFVRLRKDVARIQSPNSKPPSNPGYGKGGTGEGGGSGNGKGPGIGEGNGPGATAPLTQREKRMVRWSMLFNTTNSSDYVAQLRGLHAILAVPVKEGSSGPEYQIIRDLSTRKPAKLLKEDIHEIQRMVYWVDEQPDSVRGVMSVLRVKLKPSHFLAFMPEELEKKLLNLEIAYLHQKHPKRTEDDIEGTKFVIKIRSGKYEPEVREQKVK